jgi:AAA15 family ATPase/GTPase
MLTGLRIQNYKSWADTEQIRFAPLTGFFGTNSSGKSAILQVLLLLKQTVETSDRSRILHTGGDQYSYVDVGTFYDIIHKKNLKEVFRFFVGWNFEWGLFTDYSLKNNSPLQLSCAINLEGDKLIIPHLGYTFDQDGVSEKIEFNLERNKQNDMTYTVMSEGNKIGTLSFFEKELAQYIRKFYDFGFFRLFSHRKPAGLDIQVTELIKAFEYQFQYIHYLAPLRAFPQRTYLWTGEKPSNVGKTGELAIPVLLAANNEVRANVGNNLKELELIHDFSLKPIAEGRREHELLIQIHRNSTFVPITDVGFGVSQVLPVLVLLNYVPEGSTIILEQPEIHLHPAVQAELADVLIKAIKTRNLQIILESHSEHLLHRLQRRIAEETFTNEQAALYFCKADDEGVSHLEELKVDDYGNITNYPPKFFGDVMGDLVAMTEAAMQRRKATRKNGKS